MENDNLRDDYTGYCIGREKSALSAQGEILIDWPTAMDPKHQAALNEFDFIIATRPKQNLPAYPDAKIIKAAVASDVRDYFYNNIANGITTYQDRAIEEACLTRVKSK